MSWQRWRTRSADTSYHGPTHRGRCPRRSRAQVLALRQALRCRARRAGSARPRSARASGRRPRPPRRTPAACRRRRRSGSSSTGRPGAARSPGTEGPRWSGSPRRGRRPAWRWTTRQQRRAVALQARPWGPCGPSVVVTARRADDFEHQVPPVSSGSGTAAARPRRLRAARTSLAHSRWSSGPSTRAWQTSLSLRCLARRPCRRPPTLRRRQADRRGARRGRPRARTASCRAPARSPA